MKLTNANKLLLIIGLSVLAGCRHVSEREMVSGRWEYVSVTKNDSAVFTVAETDFIALNNDSSFRYEIESVNKNMQGRWSYADHRLALHYDQPDTTRYFDVELVSKRDMIFTENGITFKFKR